MISRCIVYMALAALILSAACAPTRTIVQATTVLQAEYELARERLTDPALPWSDAERLLVSEALASLDATRQRVSAMVRTPNRRSRVVPFLEGDSLIDRIAGDYGAIHAAYQSMLRRTGYPRDPLLADYHAEALAAYESSIEAARSSGVVKATAALRYLRVVLRGYALVKAGGF